MKPKILSKIVIDVFMTVLLMALMGRQFLGRCWLMNGLAQGMSFSVYSHHVLN
jgi:hypothetical protein